MPPCKTVQSEHCFAPSCTCLGFLLLALLLFPFPPQLFVKLLIHCCSYVLLDNAAVSQSVHFKRYWLCGGGGVGPALTSLEIYLLPCHTLPTASKLCNGNDCSCMNKGRVLCIQPVCWCEGMLSFWHLSTGGISHGVSTILKSFHYRYLWQFCVRHLSISASSAPELIVSFSLSSFLHAKHVRIRSSISTHLCSRLRLRSCT